MDQFLYDNGPRQERINKLTQSTHLLSPIFSYQSYHTAITFPPHVNVGVQVEESKSVNRKLRLQQNFTM